MISHTIFTVLAFVYAVGLLVTHLLLRAVRRRDRTAARGWFPEALVVVLAVLWPFLALAGAAFVAIGAGLVLATASYAVYRERSTRLS